MSKVLLIDGHSILNRAFYGLPDLTNAEGAHTGAVYGFLTILFKLLEEEKPDYLTVAFDVHAPTFRHEMYEAYKGTRKGMPEELKEQVPLLKKVLDAMGVCRIEQAGLEADDILGSLAKQAQADGNEVILVSGDRDLLQIADVHICIYLPRTKMGKTTIEHYYASDVQEKIGLSPAQFIELKALMGDTADNIPGVPKVGEKTALSLMQTYGSIEGIYAHLEEISRKAVRESLLANRDLCDLSLRLATIQTDCGIGLDYESAKVHNFFTEEAYTLYKRLNFKNLLHRFETEDSRKTDPADAAQVVKIASIEEADRVFQEAKEAKVCGYFFLGEKNLQEESNVLCLALHFEEEKTYCLVCESELTTAYLRKKMEDLADHSDCILSAFDTKNTWQFFTPQEVRQKEEIPGSVSTGRVLKVFDILIAAYLLNPLKNDYTAEDIASEYLSLSVPSFKELFSSRSLSDIPEEELLAYAAGQAKIAHLALAVLKKKLLEAEEWSLFTEIEMPLTYILYEMERNGILCKRDALQEYGNTLGKSIAALEKEIYEGAGETFNLNSPKQLGEILFQKLGLPGGKKTKTGYSTAADVLEELAVKYPLVRKILDYRALAKLKSTYADGLSAFIEADGRIHTIYHQTITATGRLSSAEPNLQNIPMRTEQGRLIRKVFVSQGGWIFVDADYSQIELRILAHMSDDAGLMEAYEEGRDIHRMTAARVFHKSFEDVTPDERRNAKAVNFGIVYGISSFGLSNDLRISREEAKSYMDKYFATYPGVKEYQEKAVKEAKENGYASTLFHRRRPVPEFGSSNFMQRKFGERVAMNAPIQGSAADIMKIAMIRVFKRLKRELPDARMCLQIHDELLLEVPERDRERAGEILSYEMEHAAKLKVRLEVDCHEGTDWYEAK